MDGNFYYNFNIGMTDLSRSLYLNPFFDYSSIFQPAVWHNALRWCHPPFSHILMKDGKYKLISDIELGDTVQGYTVDENRVVNVIRRNYSGKIIRFRITSPSDPNKFQLVDVTPDHELPVYAPDNEYVLKEARDIRKGDKLFIFENKKFVPVDIEDIFIFYYSGDVYSITTEPEHFYICNDVAVANCEYVVLTNGVLRAAIDRIVSFFITDIEIESTNEKNRREYKDCLIDQLNIISVLRTLGFEFITYGNFFVSFLPGFNRMLCCPECEAEIPLPQMAVQCKVHLANYDFHAECPNCKYIGKMSVRDTIIPDASKAVIKRWRPYEIVIEYDPYSERTTYLWKIPEYYKAALSRNEPVVLANADINVLEALKENKFLKFYDDVIYHGKDQTLSGIMTRGWGLSRIFSSLRHAWYFQVLNRMNEAIGLDYINPLRVITPAPRGGMEGGDPLAIRNMGVFTQNILRILDLRRRDPLIWHVSPFPLDYKVIGGDGRALAPRELIEQSMETLLASLNIPVELYRGSLRLDAAPLSLRLFETSWSHLIVALNDFLSWLGKKLHKLLEWDKVRIKLVEPRFMDDINAILTKLRLMETGKISQTTALQPLGIDVREETRRMLEEQIATAEQAVDAERRIKQISEGSARIRDYIAQQQQAMQMQQMQGVPPGALPPVGASPAPTGGGAIPAVPGDPVAQMLAMIPVSSMQNLNPAEIDNLSAQLAQQLFTQNSTVRNSFLRQLKDRNEILWMAVKAKLDDMEDSARRQGLIMAKQQAQGPPMPM
ncbi:MAG: Hint domain-containing protein [candidate division WOR-3 bacterium]